MQDFRPHRSRYRSAVAPYSISTELGLKYGNLNQSITSASFVRRIKLQFFNTLQTVALSLIIQFLLDLDQDL